MEKQAGQQHGEQTDPTVASKEVDSVGHRRRPRRKRPFPGLTFEEALQLAQAIQDQAAGKKVRRLTLFDAIGRSPDTNVSRDLITASGQYGLTKGGYQAEFLELTPLGVQATSPESSEQEKTKAQLQLAIADIPAFNSLYEAFKGNRMPSKEVMQDKLREQGVHEDFIQEGTDTFILNGQFTGIITEIAGAERIVTFDQALEGKDTEKKTRPMQIAPATGSEESSKDLPSATSDWDGICFYITPIGSEESEERKHSDLFLGSIIEPALEEFGLKVVRADNICVTSAKMGIEMGLF